MSSLLIALATLPSWIPGMPPATRPVAAPCQSEARAEPSFESRADAIARTRREIVARIERFGGPEAIRAELRGFREEVLRILKREADNGTHSFRQGGNLFGKAISQSAIKPEWKHAWDASRGELPAREVIVDFDRKLKAIGVDLIVVPVPTKIEAYAREFETAVPAGIPISLGRLEDMLYLLDHDVEVVDVLPAILSMMTDQDATPLYETSGHHVSGLGVRRLGELVAARIARYALAGRDPGRFSDVERNSVEPAGPSLPMRVWEVHLDGAPYDHVPRSPVIVIGDSNAFVYGRASWASHIARATGIPVTDISKNTGAPTAHARLAAQGLAMLRERRVVVWIMSASHMERWPWRKADIPGEVTIEGLVSTGLAEEAVALYAACGGDPARVNLRESDLNQLGNELMRGGRTREALQLFTINTELHPISANAFGVLGRVQAHLGEEARAVDSLKKALTLHPTPRTRDESLRLLAELGVDWQPPAPHVLTARAIAALVGEYALDGDRTGIVTESGGRVLFELVGGPLVTMRPFSDVHFTTHEGYELRFTPAAGDEPATVLIQGRGLRFTGRKKP